MTHIPVEMGSKQSPNNDEARVNELPSSGKTNRERKKRLVERMRRKNAGFSVGQINVHPPKSGKKITFDDDDFNLESNDPIKVTHEISIVRNHSDDESSDDEDNIEQVTASDAKRQALQQLAEESAFELEHRSLLKKKKNRSKKNIKIDVNSQSDDLSLDDELLALVDAEKEQRQHSAGFQVDSHIKPIKRNTHISFKLGADDEVGTLKNPMNAGGNIQLVVLPSSSGHHVISHAADSLGVSPSSTALQLCRNRITAAKSCTAVAENVEPRRRQKPQKRMKVLSHDQIIKRCRKTKFYIKHGRAAANFLVPK